MYGIICRKTWRKRKSLRHKRPCLLRNKKVRKRVSVKAKIREIGCMIFVSFIHIVKERVARQWRRSICKMVCVFVVNVNILKICVNNEKLGDEKRVVLGI